MNLDQLQTAQQIAIPVLASVNEIVGRLLAGAVGSKQAIAELRGTLSVASTRLDAAEEEWKKRDAENDERVRVPPESKSTR